MKILMVLTSHDQLGNTGNKTGFWLEEFAAPFYAFKDAGAEVTLVSPVGGHPPLDPKSDEPDAQTADTERFRNDAEAQQALANTGRLADVTADAFDAVFYPGGHGPLWDLAEDEHSIALIEAFAASGITKSELAKRIGKAETEARRILDPDHPTKAATMQAALAVLGKSVVVTVRNAA